MTSGDPMPKYVVEPAVARVDRGQRGRRGLRAGHRQGGAAGRQDRRLGRGRRRCQHGHDHHLAQQRRAEDVAGRQAQHVTGGIARQPLHAAERDRGGGDDHIDPDEDQD
jgi:hypothetical protein